MFVRIIGVIGLVAASWVLVGCGGGKDDKGPPSLSEQHQQALKASDPATRAKQLVKIAAQRKEAGDSSGAEESLRAAAEAANEIEKAMGRAAAFNDIAEVQGQCGMMSDAKQAIRKVRDAVEEIDDETTKVEIWSKMAVTYGMYLDNPDAAAAYLGKAKELVNKVADPVDKAKSLLTLADNYQRMEMETQANETIEAAVDTVKTIEKGRPRCDAKAELASQLDKMNQPQKAEAQFDAAIADAESLDEAVSRAHALADIAQRMGEAGRKSKARAVLSKASAEADKVVDIGFQREITDKIDSYREQLRK